MGVQLRFSLSGNCALRSDEVVMHAFSAMWKQKVEKHFQILVLFHPKQRGWCNCPQNGNAQWQCRHHAQLNAVFKSLMNVNNSFKLSKKEAESCKGRSDNCIVVGGDPVQWGENIEFTSDRGAGVNTIGEMIVVEDRRHISKREPKQSNIGRGPEGERLVFVRTLAIASGGQSNDQPQNPSKCARLAFRSCFC